MIKPLKNSHIDVIPKQNSGFDINKTAFFVNLVKCQILNFAEESLFFWLFQSAR